MITPHWEHFEHEADIGVRGYGTSVEQAFEQAALAMSSVITDLDKISNEECLEVQCQATDYDVLLVDWLNEIIYQMAIRKMLYVSYRVNISDIHLSARLCGEHADPVKHQPAVEIKGATFTELEVKQKENGEWIAQCIVDV